MLARGRLLFNRHAGAIVDLCHVQTSQEIRGIQKKSVVK